jgi:predicted aldo/keto reductase-like oxidoreductase
VKGVIVGINEENPFIDANKMITIKVNETNKEIFQDIVFTSEREKIISEELYKVGNQIVSIYILDKLKEEDTWNWLVEEKLGVSPLLNKVYIRKNS